MTDVARWEEWLAGRVPEREWPAVRRGVKSLFESPKVEALWVSGSRAMGRTDAYSDTDLRVHAPTWTEADMHGWLREVDTERALVRLSKFGPTVWNYECAFSSGALVDLLVFTGPDPVVSFDSVILKATLPLTRQPALRLVPEMPVTVDEVRNLIDGAWIDQQKFKKLLARNARLTATFLLDAQKFALLRLAYIATRGVDCGGKPSFTLASLKLIQQVVLTEASPRMVAAVEELATDLPLERGVERARELLGLVTEELRGRFPSLPTWG